MASGADPWAEREAFSLPMYLQVEAAIGRARKVLGRKKDRWAAAPTRWTRTMS